MPELDRRQPDPAPAPASEPELSLVIPACDEAGNILPLTQAIAAALVDQGVALELVWVNDGSVDATQQDIEQAAAQFPWVRFAQHAKRSGQSAAMGTGIRLATAPCIATLDADGQNDPADLFAMLRTVQAGDADFVQGDRSQARQDPWIRKLGSQVGRAARRMVIGDPVRDTGCSARVMTSDIAKAIPLNFKGMHRFMPAYARMLGARVVETPATHHPRTIGQTKYGLGIATRAFSGLLDLLAVRWMIARHTPGSVTANTADDAGK